MKGGSCSRSDIQNLHDAAGLNGHGMPSLVDAAGEFTGRGDLVEQGDFQGHLPLKLRVESEEDDPIRSFP